MPVRFGLLVHAVCGAEARCGRVSVSDAETRSGHANSIGSPNREPLPIELIGQCFPSPRCSDLSFRKSQNITCVKHSSTGVMPTKWFAQDDRGFGGGTLWQVKYSMPLQRHGQDGARRLQVSQVRTGISMQSVTTKTLSGAVSSGGLLPARRQPRMPMWRRRRKGAVQTVVAQT